MPSMTTVATSARLLISATFGVAGVSKLQDRRSFRRSIVEFGVPNGIAAVAAVALPLVEVIISVLLLPSSTARSAGAGAVVLLAIVTAAVFIKLFRGERPTCSCFGQFDEKPISWFTFSRNIVLLIGGGIVLLTHSDLPLMPWSGSTSGPVGWPQLFLLFVILQSWLTITLVRRQSSLIQRVLSLESGYARADGSQLLSVPAPDFAVYDYDGAQRDLRDFLLQNKQLILLFLDPGCETCSALLGDVQAWSRSFGRTLLFVPIVREQVRSEVPLKFGDLREGLYFQRNHAVSQLFGATGTPAAVHIKRNGNIAQATTFGRFAISQLVHAAFAAHSD